jgi:hypothetical protein
MKQQTNIRFGIIALLILVAALSRLLPHPYNFTPIGAMGLFGAAYFNRRWLAFAVPFAAMWVSDLILNNVVYARQFPEYYQGFQWFGSAPVYLSFALIVGLGLVLLRKVRVESVLIASLSASVLFFLITNFAVWLNSGAYPQNAPGLWMCYVAGLPFFGNTLLGDLFYSGVLFGAYEWMKVRIPQLQSGTERRSDRVTE